MTNESVVSKEKIYEIALDLKKHQEERRNKINEYYTSLFGAMIAASPFIDKVSDAISNHSGAYVTRHALVILSLIGVILSLTWVTNLKRVYLYLQSIDEFIDDFEKKNNFILFRHITASLLQKHAPDSITKYQFIIPSIFILIFLSTLFYSLSRIL